MGPDVWQMCLITMCADQRMRSAAIRELYFSGMEPGDIAGAIQCDDWIVQDSILGRR